MENNLPQGWVETTISEIVSNQKYSIVDGPFGSQLKRSEYVEKGIPLIRILNIGDNFKFNSNDLIRITKEKYLQIKRSKIKPGDILFSKAGTIGRVCFVPDSISVGAITSSCAKIKIHESLTSRFFLYQLASNETYNFLLSIATGSTRLNLNLQSIKKIPTKVAPLPEQHRIVEKLDVLMQKVESNKKRLEKIPKLLKRFRQSVLAAAVSGKLTEEWNDNEIEKIPLGNLIYDLKYGTSQKSEKDKKGIPILRIPNIGDDGNIIVDDLKYAELPKNEFEKLKLDEGDILLIRSNGSVALLGKAAIVSNREIGFAFAGYLIRIRCDRKKLLPEFLNLVLKTSDLRMQIEMPSRSSSGVNNINSDEVKALEIPCSKVKEQKEIVRRVEQLFTFADKIETRYNKAKAIIDKLPQSILTKAFRGELVPQDPNDEPAVVLLERIRVEKEKLNKSKEAKKKRKL